MIVTDLSSSFNPVPKPKDKVSPKNGQSIAEKSDKKGQSKEEFCIMPQSARYSTKRTEKYCERHEVFFGRAYRQKSIKDGLVVFLTENDHRGTNGVHGKNGNKLNKYLKKKAQEAWMKYYKKTKEEFIQKYGQNFL